MHYDGLAGWSVTDVAADITRRPVLPRRRLPNFCYADQGWRRRWSGGHDVLLPSAKIC